MGFAESFSATFSVLLGLVLAITAIGFRKYVYFISLGYAFSIAALGLALLLLFAGTLSWGTELACLLLLIYGCRLGTYLALREKRSASYRKAMQSEIKDGSQMKAALKVCIWLSVTVLYVLMISPIFFRLQNGSGSDGFCLVGVVMMAGGILLEGWADHQKSQAKKQNPQRFCDKGLYRLVRCPNYLGEILFWTSVLVGGLNILQGIWQWTAALLGWLCIVYIMFGGARRLEIRQNKNYGQDPEYRAYCKKTPILLPFMPLYSVEKYKWLVG